MHGRVVRGAQGRRMHERMVCHPPGRRLKSRLWASGRSSASADEWKSRRVVKASSLKRNDRPQAPSPEFIRRRPDITRRR